MFDLLLSHRTLLLLGLCICKHQGYCHRLGHCSACKTDAEPNYTVQAVLHVTHAVACFLGGTPACRTRGGPTGWAWATRGRP